jgi:hypothetical protein
VTDYFYYVKTDRIMDGNGKRALAPDISIFANLLQFIYQSDQQVLLGGKWGLDVIVPVAGFDLDPQGTPLTDNGEGVGDILVGPYIQWDPIMGSAGPLLMHRVEFQIIMPTGKYNNEDALNPGSNFLSFDPYWAGTFFILPKWTASWRLHYLFNATNDDPHPMKGADEYQAGQAIHVNFASEYEVLEKRLRLGLNGYYLKQITDDEADGKDVQDSKEQVLGFGPGAVLHLDQNNHFFCNFYFEAAAEDRSEGLALVFRYVHHF